MFPATTSCVSSSSEAAAAALARRGFDPTEFAHLQFPEEVDAFQHKSDFLITDAQFSRFLLDSCDNAGRRPRHSVHMT